MEQCDEADLGPEELVLVFSETAEFRHDSIEDGGAALCEVAGFTFTIGGEAELRAKVKRRRATVAPGKKAKFEFTVRNRGGAAATGLELCVKAPGKQVKIVGDECKSKASLGAGDSIDRTFKLKPKRSAAGDRFKVRFVANAANAGRVSETATLKVKRRKR